MRVHYFHQHFSTPHGASGTRSYEMARRLIEEGHEVRMVCGSHSSAQTGLSGPFVRGRREGRIEGIEVLEFDLNYANSDGLLRRSWTFLRFAMSSIAVALTEKSDLVFATTTPLTAAIPGIAARWLRGKPFVFEVRDLWPELPKAMGVIRNPLVLFLLGALEWAAYKSAIRLIGLSPGIVDGIARLGVDRDRISLVPNGCDGALFGETVAPWRPTGVADDDLMAIFTGAHGMANGLDSVLDAAIELKRREARGIKIVLVGDGKQKAGLIARARMEDLEDYVVFHPPVAKMKLIGLFRSADLGLQILANVPAFYYGTSPNKFFDYLAASLPVLCNYPGWIADMIREVDAGFVVPPDDPVAFANALEVARSMKEAGQLSGAGSSRLAKQFDRRVLSRTWVDVVIGRPLQR